MDQRGAGKSTPAAEIKVIICLSWKDVTSTGAQIEGGLGPVVWTAVFFFFSKCPFTTLFLEVMGISEGPRLDQKLLIIKKNLEDDIKYLYIAKWVIIGYAPSSQKATRCAPELSKLLMSFKSEMHYNAVYLNNFLDRCSAKLVIHRH